MTGAPRLTRVLVALVAAVALGVPVSCAGGDSRAEDTSTLRLGYFANITHAPALVAEDRGFVLAELRRGTGAPVTVESQVFNAGPAAVEALFADSLDIAYLGPNPAVNAFVRSEGESIRIIAGATSGGAQLVVREGIDSAEDLRGTTLATPQLGNTQDVALRAWLTAHGLRNSVQGGGDVTVSPTPSANALQFFRDGSIDGAWLAEPWASRLVLEAGATVLLDERDLWPGGEFATTYLVVRTKFLEQHPEMVEALLRGHVAAVEWINDNPDKARAVVDDGLTARTGQPLPPAALDRGWENMAVTVDPIALSLRKRAEDGVVTGIIPPPADLTGIYELSVVNRILTERGLPTVSDGGLGKE